MKKWLHSNIKAVYRVVNAGLLVCMILSGAGRFLGIGKLTVTHFVVLFTVLGILAGVNYMTARGKILCLSVSAVLLCAGMAAGSAGRPAYWQSFFLWLVGRETAPQEWETGYGLLQTAMLAAVCYLVQILLEKLPALKAGAAVLIVGILVFCLLTRREVNHFGMAFMVCFLLLSWEEWVQRHWEKRRMKENGFQVHSFWILPFLVLYLVFFMITPAPEKPYGWTWAKNVYRQLRESVQTCVHNWKWGKREGFSMAFTGFSQEGALGGDLQEDAREIMEIRVWPSVAEHLYLTGMVYDTFDGREWSQRQQGFSNAVILDTALTLYAVRNYDRRYQSDYLDEIEVEILYKDFNTGYVFAPLKTWDMGEGDFGRRGSGGTGQTMSLADTCGNGTLRWNRQKGYGTAYGLRYFHINAGQKQFDLFLEESGKTDEVNEKVWKEVMRDCERRSGLTFSVQDVEDYRKEIYELYLGNEGLAGTGWEDKDLGGEGSENGDWSGAGWEDKNWSGADSEDGDWSGAGWEDKGLDGTDWEDKGLSRTGSGDADWNGRDLGNADLGNAGLTDMGSQDGNSIETSLSGEVESYLEEVTEGAKTDLEKLRALESALSRLTYTPAPGELPESVQDSGDFLDYFLLESRQGYCTYFATAFVLLARAEGIPARYVQGYCVPLGEKGEVYDVYSYMAHAWPEAYLEGVGWIPFEPTPGYGSRRYDPWKLQQPADHTQACGDILSAGDSESDLGTEHVEVIENTDETGKLEDWEEADSGTQDTEGYSWQLFGYAFPGILLACCILLVLDHILGKYRYGRMEPEKRLRVEVFRNLRVLSCFGIDREEWETLEEFREKAGFLRVWHEEGNELPLRFLENYERVVYGGAAVGEDMIEDTLKERERLLELLRQKGKWVWFYCRLRLYMGRYRF